MHGGFSECLSARRVQTVPHVCRGGHKFLPRGLAATARGEVPTFMLVPSSSVAQKSCFLGRFMHYFGM